MLKLFILIILSIFFLLPFPVAAAGEFSSDYSVLYEVSKDGDTTVISDVSLKNLTDKYYASQITLNVNAADIREVEASDSQGKLPVEVSSVDGKTEIKVSLLQQIAGKNKTYEWKLKYKSRDYTLTDNKGFYEVVIPKLSPIDNLEGYTLTLRVPLAVGDPVSIIPKPVFQSESSGKLDFKFEKEQLEDRGILANFLPKRVLNFQINYLVENSSLLPKLAYVPIPFDNNYQRIAIKKITPQPLNVLRDDQGNYLATFQMGRKERKDIEILGALELSIDPKANYNSILSEAGINKNLESLAFQEANNLLFKSRLDEIFRGNNVSGNLEKASLINDYVVRHLDFNFLRIRENDFTRLGAVTALANPQNSLASEFTDLFVALSKASGIPARGIVGVSLASNTTNRPLSFKGRYLHVWPEIYDSNGGFIRFDPTWEKTLGVSYRQTFDLNHLSLGTLDLFENSGVSIKEVRFSENDEGFNYSSNLEVGFDAEDQITAGFPAKAKITLKNSGQLSLEPLQLKLTAEKIKVLNFLDFKSRVIPPLGSLEYEVALRSNLLDAYKDRLDLTAKNLEFGDIVFNKSKEIAVEPFFVFKAFPFVVILAIFLMVVCYGFLLQMHLRIKEYFLFYKFKPVNMKKKKR